MKITGLASLVAVCSPGVGTPQLGGGSHLGKNKPRDTKGLKGWGAEKIWEKNFRVGLEHVGF